MERFGIVEDDMIVNVVKAPSDWADPSGREIVHAPRGSNCEIGARRSADGSWVIPPAKLTAEEARGKRDRLLAACDWTQVADAPVDQAAWAAYRQALRDVPAQAGFPDNVTWPTAP